MYKNLTARNTDLKLTAFGWQMSRSVIHGGRGRVCTEATESLGIWRNDLADNEWRPLIRSRRSCVPSAWMDP